MKQNIISPNPNVLIKDMNQVEFVSFMVNTVSPTMVQHQLDNLDQVMDQTTEVIEKVMPRAIKIAENAIDQAEENPLKGWETVVPEEEDLRDGMTKKEHDAWLHYHMKDAREEEDALIERSDHINE